MEGHKTKLTEAGEGGLRFRTTLPAAIRKHFGLKKGDELYWNLDKIENEWVILVKPFKKDKE